MTTTNIYGIESTHDFKKEIEDTLRSGMERQTRADMHDEPSHEAVVVTPWRFVTFGVTFLLPTWNLA